MSLSRETVTIEKRRVLTRMEVIELSVRQVGKCGCGCGLKLDALKEGVTDEHRIPLALGGTNDLSNRELWRNPCSLAKTKTDFTSIAKAKRLAGETCNGPTRKIPQRVNAWGEKGSRKIPSRPFPKRAKPTDG